MRGPSDPEAVIAGVAGRVSRDADDKGRLVNTATCMYVELEPAA